MSPARLAEYRGQCEKEYNLLKAKGLKLDMSRGKPGADQLDLSMDMLLNIFAGRDGLATINGTDCRNYGLLDGIPEAKQLFCRMLGVPASNIIICGNSSLNIMYDMIARGMTFGVAGGSKPWSLCEKRKWLCPVPGYDRHFAITELFGFEMINIPMDENGPDMDMIERLVAEDDTIKGIWCVPLYSNPTGISYSDETVRRFAALRPKADDFRIFWDNAYAIHHLTDTPDSILNIYDEAMKLGNQDIVYIFGSTSKITFPGSGVAMIGASDANIAHTKKIMSIQTIGHDKLNQLRHVEFFKDYNGVLEHMKKHRAILEPKFSAVLQKLEADISPLGIASWNHPHGGYFIAVDTMDGCAKATVALCKEAGVIMTDAGATYPYGNDPRDRNIRVAPTYPSLPELESAVEVFCASLKLASCRKALGEPLI